MLTKTIMSVTICKCSAINSIQASNSIRASGMCSECGVCDTWVRVCSSCMYEGLNGPLATCEPCKEQHIYDSVPTLPEPPKPNASAVKTSRLPDKYSTSRWTRCSKPDPFYVHKKWKRLHEQSIARFRSIKYEF